MEHENVDAGPVSRVKNRIKILTERLDPKFHRRYRNVIRRGTMKRMIHTMIKVEFGLDFRVLNEAVDLLVNIIEARILNLMDASNTSADCYKRNTIVVEDLTLAATLLEANEHGRMLRNSVNNWKNGGWRMYRYRIR